MQENFLLRILLFTLYTKFLHEFSNNFRLDFLVKFKTAIVKCVRLYIGPRCTRLYFYNKSPAISWWWRTELWTNFRLRSEPKGPITWSIFNPGVELSPVYRVEISALSVIQNSIKIKRAIDYMTKFSTQG